MKLGTIYKMIEAHQNEIGKRRDKLDAFLGEIEGLKESCDKAWDDLQSARDHLSEYV